MISRMKLICEESAWKLMVCQMLISYDLEEREITLLFRKSLAFVCVRSMTCTVQECEDEKIVCLFDFSRSFG